jgi:hypothetical protein
MSHPNLSAIKFLIIGDGKIAKHFSYYFEILKINYCCWNRGLSASDLDQKIATCSHVFLLIKDSAIEEFYKKNVHGKAITAVHFSGSLSLPGILDFHPLMTFGSKLYDQNFYFQIPFVSTVPTTLPGIPNKVILINKEDKPLYHALCVVAGNFPQALFSLAKQHLLKLGMPAEAINSYGQQSFFNVLENAQAQLTGPLARKDHRTIEENLKSLAGTPFVNIYKAMQELYEHSPI